MKKQGENEKEKPNNKWHHPKIQTVEKKEKIEKQFLLIAKTEDSS